MANNGNFVELDFDWDNLEVWYRNKMRILQEIPKDKALKYNLATTYADLIDPWVPYDTRDNVHLSDYTIDRSNDYSIVYDPIANNKYHYHYAQIQYDTNFKNRNRTVHPKATNRWDVVAYPHIANEWRLKAGRLIWEAYKKQVLGKE